MIYRVNPPTEAINVNLDIPSSKSISNRLLILHRLSQSAGVIRNPSDSDDTEVMQRALSSDTKVKDVGHAGTSMRFLCAFYSSQPGEVILTGSQRMKERPIGPLVDALKLMGADIQYQDRAGYPPLKIKGKTLKGGKLHIDGSVSSQFISALLMIAPLMEHGLHLILEGKIVSRSYIQMTIELMKRFGAQVRWEDQGILVQNASYNPLDIVVESDWSAASYWYSIAQLYRGGKLQLRYFENNSLQGDHILMGIYEKLGIQSVLDSGSLTLSEMENVRNPDLFTLDLNSSPDLVQSLSVNLCLSSIPFRFTGTQTLRIKETDRIDALQTEMAKLGYVLESDKAGSFLSWQGDHCEAEEDPLIETYHDHRMAMAFAPAALRLGSIRINDPGVVSKSYPKYWDDLRKAGFRVTPE